MASKTLEVAEKLINPLKEAMEPYKVASLTYERGVPILHPELGKSFNN